MSTGHKLVPALAALIAVGCTSTGTGSSRDNDMRCHFHLVRPASGMADGGQGQCQLPSGKTIEAAFAQQ
jgi:hypothetical protein